MVVAFVYTKLGVVNFEKENYSNVVFGLNGMDQRENVIRFEGGNVRTS